MPKVLREYECQCGPECGCKLQVEQQGNGNYTLYLMEHPRHGWASFRMVDNDWHNMRSLLDEYDDYYGIYMADGENSHAVILSRDDLDNLRELFGMGKRELPTAP